jgi:two-component system sensor histidine kinase CiaH
LVLLVSLEKNVRNVVYNDKLPRSTKDELFKQNIDDIETDIMITDLSLLFLVTWISYIIAGRTLLPIKEALESQKRFSADASHDLRTPLAILTTESEVLLQSHSTDIEDYKKVIISNLEEANKMSALVSDLLLIARTEDKLQKSNTVSVDIKGFIEQIVKKVLPQATEKEIAIEIMCIESGQVKIHPNHFERALQNIIQNAIHYTKQGGKIEIKIRKENSKLVIVVADTGVGIAKSDLPYVFDRFYKASHSRNDASGSGLGLPIARQIIEQHGGTIRIDSTEGVGTSVSIKMPKQQQ